MDGTTEEEEANHDAALVVPVERSKVASKVASTPHAIAVAMTLYILQQSEPSTVGTDKIPFEVKVT